MFIEFYSKDDEPTYVNVDAIEAVDEVKFTTPSGVATSYTRLNTTSGAHYYISDPLSVVIQKIKLYGGGNTCLT